MKLEGAGGGGSRRSCSWGSKTLRARRYRPFLHAHVGRAPQRVRRALGLEGGEADISLRPYGWNAVSGRPPPAGAPAPLEIGLMFVATAATQALATEIAKVCNPFFFHLPVRDGKELPSYGFPFSPAEIERGQVFEFLLNHVVETATPFELVRTRWVGHFAAAGVPAHA